MGIVERVRLRESERVNQGDTWEKNITGREAAQVRTLRWRRAPETARRSVWMEQGAGKGTQEEKRSDR